MHAHPRERLQKWLPSAASRGRHSRTQRPNGRGTLLVDRVVLYKWPAGQPGQSIECMCMQIQIDSGLV
jgi:hypothetical protein